MIECAGEDVYIKLAAYERTKKAKVQKCACIMRYSAFLHLVLQMNTAHHKMFATDKYTVCGVEGERAKEKQHFHLPEDVCEKRLWRDSAKYIDIKASTAVGRAKLSEIMQGKSNHNLVPCYCYC